MAFFCRGLFFFVACFCFIPVSSFAADECVVPVGTLVSVEGEVYVLHLGQTVWQSIHQENKICAGDMLRVDPDSRAAVLLVNETVLRLNQNSTLTFRESDDEQPLLLDILKGVIHIFSHRPRSLKIKTPYVNGAVEGTEFLVQVRPEGSVLTVFKGLVSAANSSGKLQVESGQTVVARDDSSLKHITIIRPRDAIQWTLYYPAILENTSEPGKGESVVGNINRAARMLSVGQVTEARENIRAALKEYPGNSDALALRAIIAIVQNRREEAQKLADMAVESDPGSTSARLALSYVQQARFDIYGALSTLEEAARIPPGNALVKARLAELFLSVGELDNALTAADEAARLDPKIERTQTVLGFAYLVQLKPADAVTAFKQAITLDQASPLPRLGLGLARIRNGNLEEGRSEIEIAAALDPGSAMIRSYLGKAYFEEKRDGRSSRQYEVAKELDPSDPTPWFYDAIRKQTVNRPVEALQDLQQSIALNDNRAVFRSRLLLDSDLAARSASLARIYSDLGFQQLALVEGRKSVNTDPANYSAHRFLADSYATMPRHEIARVSEVLQSQLLQPININPVQPQLAESSLYILEGAGPADPSFNEYNPLFFRNRLALQASGVVGGNNTLGDELVQSGVVNAFSYSVGQFYYQTDGFRNNNDQKQNIYNAYIQGMLNHKTSIMSEIRYKKNSFGDLNVRFNPTEYWPAYRQTEETRSLRIGARHDLSTSATIIGTAIIGSDDSEGTGIPGFEMTLDIEGKSDNLMAEVQHLYSGSWFQVVSGGGALSAEEEEYINMTFPPLNLSAAKYQADHINLYSYGHVDLPADVLLTVGLSVNMLDSPVADKDELNPKVGLSWQPFPQTTLRAAAFKTLHRRFIYAQTVEPTQVSGFNQFINDFPGSTTWNYGVGLDQTFTSSVFGGLQFVHRDLSVPFTAISPLGLPEQVEDDWKEKIGSAYLYWAPHPWFSLRFEYFYEEYSHDKWEGPQGIQELTTYRLVPAISFYHPSGISANLRTSYVDQEGDFGSNMFGFTCAGDEFWIVDASISYRLPKRYGMLTLGVNNLFDEQFQFVDSDPSNPRFKPEQQIVGRLTVSF